MSIEDDIDAVIRDCAAEPGMCEYPSWGATDRGSRNSSSWTETRSDPPLPGILRVERERPGAWWHHFTRRVTPPR